MEGEYSCWRAQPTLIAPTARPWCTTGTTITLEIPVAPRAASADRRSSCARLEVVATRSASFVQRTSSSTANMEPFTVPA